MGIKATEVLFSIGTWAAELGVTRDVLRRILAEAGTTPAGKRAGHPVYRARDVVAAWAKSLGATDDPDALRPMERKLHYQAEREKLNLQVDRGELVPSLEVEQGQGQIFAIVTQSLETLPDVLERDVGLSALQLARVERHLDQLREALYQKLNEDAVEDDADRAVSDRA